MISQPTPDAPSLRMHFHPLEIIPFFRRWRCSVARDFTYTFIWNCMFGVGFAAMAMLFGGRMPDAHLLGLDILIANLIGYSIHLLFVLGALAGLDAAARRGGLALKMAYFSLVPVIGVFAGYWIASFIIDVGLRRMFSNPGILLSILSVSLMVSIVLSLVFFWRERSAVAEAESARERERSGRIEREAALANLRALQAQIEPHFLFNTLANVASLVDPDPGKAKHMLESFIRFLRASLNATRRESTTLAEEGELIGAYLDVLHVRMGSRLRYRIEIDPALGAFALPPMLLQPVVENAIRHGLEPQVEGGELVMRAYRDAGQVAIEIADTGAGFAPVTRGGVGLTNLRGRLRLLYGDRASLAVAQNGASGAVVSLRLPA